MKKIFEFNMPEDQEEYDIHNKAIEYSIIVSDFEDYLRAQIKYHSDEYTKDQYELLEKIREEFNSIRNDRLS